MLRLKVCGISRSVTGLSLILCVVFSLSFVFTIDLYEVCAEEEYTYYGVIPSKIFRWNLTDGDDINSGWRLDTGSVDTSSLVAIVAYTDDTNVKLYDLRDNELVSEAQLDRMEKHLVSLPNGTSFKVVSDDLVFVMLLGYDGMPPAVATEGPVPNTFYPSTDGAYVGKEFIFMACQTTGMDYWLFALENSDVTVTRDDGDERTYSLDVNTYKELMLRPFRVYRVQSTGHIMVQSGRPVDFWGWATGFSVPSAEGGFLGKVFYTGSNTAWDAGEDYGFQVSALEDTKVTVLDLVTKQTLATEQVEGGSGFRFQATYDAIVVQSDKPVTLSFVHSGKIEASLGNDGIYGGYGSGVAFIGVKPNEETPFYLPTESYVEAYVFSHEETSVTVDGMTRTIEADSYFEVTSPGYHKILSGKGVVIELLHWPSTPESQGLLYNGVAIPSIQKVDVMPDVTLTPLGEGFPMMYVMIGAAAAVVAIVVVVFVLRRGRT